ncbi:coniferyl alcohol acyltransferase [Humulus lupulus]|uniref:coniferyl alcohol acyltransferase n=1 Tax=Humulus lupulus TaxID=3486 RepID=UPI002B402171|nr:coniferyl alcohol acyltransferase [Humulus lupulus]
MVVSGGEHDGIINDVHHDCFKVKVSQTVVVAAALPMQDHWLPLSNLDLLLPAVDVGVLFCYSNITSGSPTSTTTDSFGAKVWVLKKALAQALVTFYAFSGELVKNAEGEPELLCNNGGVDYAVAYADVELSQLDLYNPDDSFEGKLVPGKKRGVLAVQVTELKCGGIVVACTFDHRIADAYSANMFLISWAHIAQSKHFSLRPSFRRSLLNPRRHASRYIDSSLDDMYVPVTALPPPPPSTASAVDQLISRVYYVKAEQLEWLQAQADTGNRLKRPTKLESFSAFLWKMVAKCAASEHPEKICKMGLVVDGRRRLGRTKAAAEEMDCYFGNVLSIPFGGKRVEELVDEPLSWVAGEVREFLGMAVTEEHFLGLIDWVEAHRPVPGLAKIYCQGSEDGPAFVVSSGQRFPVTEIDFGWGEPVFGSYHFPWGGDSGYVMPMPSTAGNGDWVVYMHLQKKQIQVIEEEAAHVFRPFKFDYVLNNNDKLIINNNN